MALTHHQIRYRLIIVAAILYLLVFTISWIGTVPQSWPIHDSNQILWAAIRFTIVFSFLSATCLTLEPSLPQVAFLSAIDSLAFTLRAFAQIFYELSQCANMAQERTDKYNNCALLYDKETAESTITSICLNAIGIDTSRLASGIPNLSHTYLLTGSCPSTITTIFEVLFLSAISVLLIYTVNLAYPLYKHYTALKKSSN